MRILVDWILQPGVVTLLVAYLFTYLLRHRLYLYAWARQSAPGKMRHVFVLQNLENVDLTVAMQLQVSTTNNVGLIRDARLECGPAGPRRRDFACDEQGVQRRTLTVLGMQALDTWKVVVTTNDEAGSVRLRIQGWDVRRDIPRWHVPTMARGGLSIRSHSSGAEREWTRPAKVGVLLAGPLFLYAYVAVVSWLSNDPPAHSWPAMLSVVRSYLWSVTPRWEWKYDGFIMLVMFVVSLIALSMTALGQWRRIFTGYIGDKVVEEEVGCTAALEEEDRRVEAHSRERVTSKSSERHFPESGGRRSEGSDSRSSGTGDE